MSEQEPLNLFNFFSTDKLSHLNKPITIPQVDLSKVFNDIRTRYPTNAIQDLMRSFLKVIFLSTLPHFEKKIIKSLLANCKKSNGIYYDSHYSYVFKVDSSFENFKGRWWNRVVSGKRGDNLFSLVRTIKGCSDSEAFFYVSSLLDVDLSDQDVVQYQSLNDETFVRESHAYPVEEKHSASTLYGSFYKEYTFKNDHGCPSFKLQVWNRNHELYQLFYSLQHCKKTGEKKWSFISPPFKYLIFNRHLIDKNKDIDVYIHDDINRADSKYCCIDTWSGDFSISALLDWDFLRGRNVTYMFDEFNFKSTMIGFQLIEKFMKISTQLKLQSVYNESNQKKYQIDAGHENTLQNYVDSSDIQINNLYSCANAQGDIAIDDFYEFAKNYHKIEIKSHEINNRIYSKTYNELDDLGDTVSSMVENLFNEGQYIVMTAEQKVGKSLFALDLCLMISTGGSIGDERYISASKSYKTLLIDGEIPENEFKKRMSELMDNYDNKINILNNNNNYFRCYNVRPKHKKLDLSTLRDQQFIENEIQDARFVVFDNLGKLVPTKVINNDNLWEPVSEWFKSLTDGRTVFIVHHENAKKERRGTAKIYDDVDLALSLRNTEYRPSRGKIIELYIDDARYLHEDKTTFCFINYFSENNKTKRIVHKDGRYLKNQDKSLVLAEDIFSNGLIDVQNIISRLDITDNQKEIAYKIYEAVRASGKDGLGLLVLMKQLNLSEEKRSATKIILKKLCDCDLLKHNGKKQGSKYYLPNNFPSDYQLADQGPEEKF